MHRLKMPPTLRQTTKKVAATLPQHAKFSFLLEASELMSRLNLPLSGHLGAAALKVSCNIETVQSNYGNPLPVSSMQVADKPDAAIAARTVMQLCESCGLHLNSNSISRCDLLSSLLLQLLTLQV
jgi:hypothetical protein